MSHMLATAQFVLLPLLALVGAAFATGFPTVDSPYKVETRYVQFTAMLAGVCSGIVTAFALRITAALRARRCLLHVVLLATGLFGAHVLWVQPVWGFHHDYALGVFAWLFIGGEEGFRWMPNLLGLPLTAGCYCGLMYLLRVVRPDLGSSA